MTLFTALIIAWYVSGVASFVYWWTRTYDLTETEIFVCTLAGILGPFAWFVGKELHGEPRTKPPKVLIKCKRTKRYQ